MECSVLLSFLAAVVALQLSPGPDMLLIIGRGIGQGRRVAMLTALGATLGAGLVQLPLLALGLASVIERSPSALGFIRVAGSVYLVWLGARLLIQSRGSREPIVTETLVSGWEAMRDGMVSNLTNPKVLIFMLALLPQFVEPRDGWSVTAQLLVLGTLQKLSGFLVLGSVALGSGWLGSSLTRRPTLAVWQKRTTGCILVGLGLWLGLAGNARLAQP